MQTLKCPNCGYALSEKTKANQLVKCPACEATVLVSEWNVGDTSQTLVVATPTRTYTISDLLAKDDVCNDYRCIFKVEERERQGLFRIARYAEDNDLVQNEASILYHFPTMQDYEDFRGFLPMVLESFVYQDATATKPRRVNILALHEKIESPREFYSLEEVHHAFSQGIHRKDMAWMWRRLLNVLGFVHQSKVIHGGVLPSTVWIEPKEHKLVLMGWNYAVRDERLQAISATYEGWYPPSVKAKETATPAIDIGMAARCMMYLIGTDPLSDFDHPALEIPLRDYFVRCTQNRAPDAWQLLTEFDHLIEDLWGPREFRVFRMPRKD